MLMNLFRNRVNSGLGTRALVLAGVAMGCVAAAAGPAAAQADDPMAQAVQCRFNGDATFDPAVFVFPQDTTLGLRGGYAGCTDDDGLVDQASFNGEASGKMTCFKSPQGTTGKAQINWRLKNGTSDQSIVNFSLTGSTLNNGKLDGDVQSGRYQGKHFSANLSVDIIDGAIKCLSGGASQARFKGTFQIS